MNLPSIITFGPNQNKIKIKIETEHLILKSYSDEDFENSYLLYSNVKLTKFFDHGQPRSRVEVENYIKHNAISRFTPDEPFGIFSVFVKNSGAFAGQVDILPSQSPGTLEIGCILFREFHNTGFAFEALKALTTEFVNTLNMSGYLHGDRIIRRIIATAHPKNYPSQKLILKLGMTYEKTEERFGQPRIWYSMPVASQH